MKYVSVKNGYMAMGRRIVGSSVNMLDDNADKPPPREPEPEVRTNMSIGIIRPPAPLIKGGDLLKSLQKINFSKNTKDNKRKNIVFSQ